ncbi:hypothetical protein OAE88_00560 [bacterium]|nr:hypothetical protein [bacterium]
MVNWTHKGKDIPSNHIPKKESFGFIYLLTYTNGQKYVGKKQMWSKRKVPLGKKELANRTDKRASKFKTVIKTSDWFTYNGSAKYDKHLKLKAKEIIHICKTKKALTYMEIREQFKRDVLTDATYVNENINRMWYRNVME